MNEILLNLVTSGAILGGVGFLVKSIIGQLLEKDVLAYKVRLEEQSANALSAYRSDLEKERIRLQISYGGIFEKQATTIMQLFEMLSKFQRQMGLVLNGDEEGTEYSKFVSVWKELIDTYEDRKILLPPEIDRGFEEIISLIFMTAQDYRITDQRMSLSGHRLSETQFSSLCARQDKALEIMEKIPALKNDLAEKLRPVIGIHSPGLNGAHS